MKFLERGIVLRFFDVFFSVLGIVLVSVVFKAHYLEAYRSNLLLWLMTYAVYWLVFGEIFELYQLAKTMDWYFLGRSILLTTSLTTLFYVFTPKITPLLPQSRLEIILFFTAMTVPVLLWRWVYNQLFYQPIFLKNIVVVGTAEEVSKTCSVVEEFSKEYKVVGYVSNARIDSLSPAISYFNQQEIDIKEMVRSENITSLIVSDTFDREFSAKFSSQLLKLFKKGLSIITMDDFLEQMTKRISKNRLNDRFYKHFSYSKYNQDTLYLGFIRLFDILAAFLGLAFLGMLLPFIALINMGFNKGPLFYSQMRIGLNGIPFRLYKLRTMKVGAEQGTALWATKDDIRASRFGKFLRKTRIDEIPQFVNVLKGEMSVIGPRPERPEFVAMLENKLPYYALRYVIKPGLTGWAQVEYPYANSVEDQEMKLRYDLYYIRERNALLDFKIILKTINTVLFYKGY